jgi:hypothetical protein
VGQQDGGSGFDAIFHAVALALDDNGLGMMEDAVEDGRGEGGVVVEDGGPVFEDLVGAEDDRAGLVALADDLEEQVGPVLVDGQVADFIDHQQWRASVLPDLLNQSPGVLRGGQGVDDVDGGGEADGKAGGGRGMAQGDAQVTFSQAHRADDDDVGFVLDELEAEEVLHGQSVDFGRPGEVELLEGFEHREPALR